MGRVLLVGLVLATVVDAVLGQTAVKSGPIIARDDGATPTGGAVSPYQSNGSGILIAPPRDEPSAAEPVENGAIGGWAPRFWGDVEYLLWRVRSDSLPALIATSPSGTPRSLAGVPGTAGLATLFGGSVNDDWRSGGRLRVGAWLDCGATLGVEASAFMLANSTSGFTAASSGSPILARPFFNVLTGMPDSELVAFPGILAGATSARENSTLFGAGALLRCNVCCGECSRVDALFGYRYLRLTGRLGIAESLVSTDPSSQTVPLGTQVSVVDRFDTTNDFHGADLGLTGEVRRGPWALEWLAKIAVGPNHGVVDIGGATAVTVPGFATQFSPGGLLALSSNSGHFERNQFAVVPEVGVKLAYQFTPRVRAFVGYDFLYWTNVVRPGGQIDTTVNPALLPPIVPPVTGPIRPAPLLGTSDIWVQGISLGVEFRY